MTCQKKRILITSLAPLILALGVSVECRADGMGIEAPSAVSVAQKKTLLCSWHLSPCFAALGSSRPTVRSAIWQGGNQDGLSQLALDTSITETAGQTSDDPASGEGVNLTVASMGSGKSAHEGKLALNMMLDNYYHGDIFNSEAPFEAMQVSLNYTHSW